jgi:hypothetical protein
MSRTEEATFASRSRYGSTGNNNLYEYRNGIAATNNKTKEPTKYIRPLMFNTAMANKLAPKKVGMNISCL